MKAGKARGFTLIELMIVVAVVAILAAIAYPSYVEHVRKSRRAQAKADLVELAQLAERHHTVNNSYIGFDLPFEHSPREATATAWYDISMEPAATQSAFTLVATAKNDQTKDRCGNLSLNQTGVKAASKGSLAECW